MLRFATILCAVAVLIGALSPIAMLRADDKQPWVVYSGGEGPGKGKHIVLVSGDEEYRSEEALPQLGKILATRHGFKCTVLFAIDPKTGAIDPNVRNNIPGLEALKDADLMILFTRMRDLPDDQMKHVIDYLDSGKPIVAMRTATHAFQLDQGKAYRKYTWNSNEKGFEGGFGRQVLGETWISHHGNHGRQSTRGVAAPDAKDHPILRGISPGEIWGPSDVYGVRLPLPGDSKPVVLGQVLEGMKFDDKPVAGKQNDPMMPVAWTKSYTSASGKSARIFTTTMGASTDLVAEGTRRMMVNACYWCLGMDEKIPAKSDVAIVGEFKPRPFSFNGAAKGVMPAEHALK